MGDHKPSHFDPAEDMIPVGVRVNDRARPRTSQHQELAQKRACVRDRGSSIEHDRAAVADNRTNGRPVGRPRRHPVDVFSDLRQRAHGRGAEVSTQTNDPVVRGRLLSAAGGESCHGSRVAAEFSSSRVGALATRVLGWQCFVPGERPSLEPRIVRVRHLHHRAGHNLRRHLDRTPLPGDLPPHDFRHGLRGVPRL
jgi:hypothetical protein